ncbi:probable protein phosphatase 2C 25 isoform X1 [Ricinus communis]|uniref:protein-serine/threonine phosphatase n=1 Tax=Ricinus communis TaxID=3988 RepID=B9SQP1_RICCO|nr:probable protein phosphatase 2C 25 isoform X1 [Ricinus communis]EEF34068.1 protein phosphatase 2c, putative [Ricinus communis]|eukprot:XP_002528310.1 probable protein phosphatase 2C 25 [Ricinus communis]
MPAAVAVHVPDSPIFSSPRLRPPIFCKPCPSPSPSPSRTVLSLTSTSTSPVASSPSSSPKSPLAIPEKAKSGAAVLKRKRPARIDIPVMQGVWGGGLETPRKEEAKISEVMEVEEDCYSVYCKRGKRGHMEDRFSASVNFNGVSKQGFFGVYDGHGGANAADFACKNLEKNVMDEVLNRCDNNGIEMAIRNGYLSTDKEFLNQSDSGGACCVTAMIYKGDLVVSNAGDCRAVISRGGVAEALTSDHQPSRLDERDRIQSLGGYVDYCHGRWRIQGSLAVTRGIGDKHFKEFVIAEPETQILRINPDCEFLILASDGLWDKVTNQEAVDLIRPLCIGVEKPEPFTACKRLVELALRRCSMDDISVMIIQLGRFIS